MRAVATKRARPVLASQAENARSSRGEAERFVEFSSRAHMESPRNKDSIIPSRHNKADKRWVRWKVSPANPSMNAIEKEKFVGVISWPWGLTGST